MPRTNGFEVLKLLRMANVGNSRSIPVIASTASGNCDTGDLYAAGFSGCLKKPFSAEELLQVCTECLGSERQSEQIDLDALLKYGNMMQMLWVILTIVLPCFQFVAGILPLLIPGTAIKLVGAVKGK